MPSTADGFRFLTRACECVRAALGLKREAEILARISLLFNLTEQRGQEGQAEQFV